MTPLTGYIVTHLPWRLPSPCWIASLARVVSLCVCVCVYILTYIHLYTYKHVCIAIVLCVFLFVFAPWTLLYHLNYLAKPWRHHTQTWEKNVLSGQLRIVWIQTATALRTMNLYLIIVIFEFLIGRVISQQDGHALGAVEGKSGSDMLFRCSVEKAAHAQLEVQITLWFTGPEKSSLSTRTKEDKRSRSGELGGRGHLSLTRY